jgi:hypothetical protein
MIRRKVIRIARRYHANGDIAVQSVMVIFFLVFTKVPFIYS